MAGPGEDQVAAGATDPQIEKGSYEIIRERLVNQAGALAEKTKALNASRLEIFGGAELAIVGNERIRTENNCVPCDIVGVGDRLLFGYNVFIGLKTETSVEDVFSVHRFSKTEDGFSFEREDADFLKDPVFVKEFGELYQYYKDTRLVQLRRTDGKLLAVFRTGSAAADVKVFRWLVSPEGDVTYVDNKGERDHVFPPSHDFEWHMTTREDHVAGVHPHVSILDEVFVETVGGDLTVKIEDNTEDGTGIYREPVEDADQALHDADIRYAKVGTLILIRIRPYREETWRYLLYNTRARTVHRIDAIGQACVQLPEDHGVIFPGGYYLQTGATQTFPGDITGMQFARMLRSPNGEDVLYVFNDQRAGNRILLSYNVIRKEVENPIPCHGYSLFDDGKMVVFRSITDDPTRVHGMSVWQTPFTSDEHAARTPTGDSYLERVGNADLVRGISDSLSICRLVDNQRPTMATYEDLIAAVERTLHAYHWLENQEIGDFASTLHEIQATAELVIDEFEKVQLLQKRADESIEEAVTELRELVRTFRPDHWETVDPFVTALGKLRVQRGHLITLREVRYIDRDRLATMEDEVVEHSESLSAKAVEFLLQDGALDPYRDAIVGQQERVDALKKVTDANALGEEMEETGQALDLLIEIVGALEIDDATLRTRILESISEVLSHLNRGRALLQARRKELMTHEGAAEFGAQFQLLSQSVTSALTMADTPQACDDQLSRLMLQMEELEGRFSEFDDYIEQLATKREDVYEAFSSKKQVLLDERQRKAERLMRAAERVLEGVARRAGGFKDQDQLNAYFASDAMISKLREQAERLLELGDSVKSEEIGSRLKAAQDQASRALRDRIDIFEEGASIIRLGRHRFSVNTQRLDLTMVPRGGGMALHLTGTDFYEQVTDEDFDKTREFWDQVLVSETETVYRAEYLAGEMLALAEEEKDGLSVAGLVEAASRPEGLLEAVRHFSTDRYDEGYERGLHDHDAALLLEKLLGLHQTADLLRFAPLPRALACLYWAFAGESVTQSQLVTKARSLARLRATFCHGPQITAFTDELASRISDWLTEHSLVADASDVRVAGLYLFEELAKDQQSIVTGAGAVALNEAFTQHLHDMGQHHAFQEATRLLEGDVSASWPLVLAWMTSFVSTTEDPEIAGLAPAVSEAASLIVSGARLERTVSSALSSVVVDGLLGQHRRVEGRKMNLRLDEFLGRIGAYRHERVPAFRTYQALRHELLERERDNLRLSEFMPKVMSGFVRNQLINEVYLPLIGDNLAKQIGAAGDAKRTDLMGLLLLISPPGYGKTMLMEYMANRLGMIFMKINGPALGHHVTSIDPASAPDATSAQELEKLNLAFEMGNNVLCYVDDIQHTNPEFLQKFISLCDAQRKVEGVWRGRTRTYDLRGKRFAVCMAGNPYTESGDKFQIPDMLANRADIYNLGDILSGKERIFADSYIENSLTSNPVLAPLTTRDPADVEYLIKMAKGAEIAESELSHDYSSVELAEVKAVLQKALTVRDVLLLVNAEYIRSASMDDNFRTEPRFQLQGSYRNMNKMCEKIVAVMNDDEVQALIDDHYQQESQTLTTGAEQNLLKLAELRGRMSEEEESRWAEVKRGFERIKVAGASDEDPVSRVTAQLSLLSERLGGIGQSIEEARTSAGAGGAKGKRPAIDLAPYLEKLDATLARLAERGPAAAGGSPESLAPLLKSLEKGLGKLAAPAASKGAGDPSALAPYLDKLDATLTAMATSRDSEQGENLAEVLAPVLEGLGEKLSATSASSPALSDEAVEKMGKHIASVASGLEDIKMTLNEVASAPPQAAAGEVQTFTAPQDPLLGKDEFQAYLQRMDKAMQSLAKSQQITERGRRLGGAVHDLLDKHVLEVRQSLGPVLQAMGKRLKSSAAPADKQLLDKVGQALKALDAVKELTDTLREGDARKVTKRPAVKKTTKKKS